MPSATGKRLELTPAAPRRRARACWTSCSAGCAAMSSVAMGTYVGRGGERDVGSLPYEFGRPFDLDLQGTLANALTQTAARTTPACPRASTPQDFEVHETEDCRARGDRAAAST